MLKYGTFPVARCVTHPDDGDVIAEICRGDRNVTIVFTACVCVYVCVCVCVSFVNKTHSVIACNEQH